MGRRIYTEKERSKERSPAPGRLWQEFCYLEEQAVEYAEFVPLVEEHLTVWSPRLANMICSAAGIFDSFSRAAIHRPEFEGTSFDEISGKPFDVAKACTSKNKELKIGHYRAMYTNAFPQISSYEVLVRSHPEEFQMLRPFESFEHDDSAEGVPRWWRDYNALKHERFKLDGNSGEKATIERATFGTLLETLAACFLAQLLVSSYHNALVELGIIRANRGYTMPELSKALNSEEWQNEDARIAARSRLFGFAFPTKGMCEPLTRDTTLTYKTELQELFQPYNPEGYDHWRRAR